MKTLINNIKKQGYRVFIADNGNGKYGFYTDQDGSRIISFQNEFSAVTFSGNYKTNKPRQTGTGWRIADTDTGNYKNVFNAHPPQWAVRYCKWSFTTLDQHLKTYQKSSKYKEV